MLPEQARSCTGKISLEQDFDTPTGIRQIVNLLLTEKVCTKLSRLLSWDCEKSSMSNLRKMPLSIFLKCVYMPLVSNFKILDIPVKRIIENYIGTVLHEAIIGQALDKILNVTREVRPIPYRGYTLLLKPDLVTPMHVIDFKFRSVIKLEDVLQVGTYSLVFEKRGLIVLISNRKFTTVQISEEYGKVVRELFFEWVDNVTQGRDYINIKLLACRDCMFEKVCKYRKNVKQGYIIPRSVLKLLLEDSEVLKHLSKRELKIVRRIVKTMGATA